MELLDKVQSIFPDKVIKVVEACKGVDRLREVPIATQPQFMPFRRTFGRRRADQQVYCDESWERWDRMSKRQIRREGVPSKIAITIFADNPIQSISMDMTTKTESNIHEPPVSSDMPDLKKMRIEEPNPKSLVASPMEIREHHAVPSELTCPEDKAHQASMPTHGPMFRALAPSVQAQITKIHKNLGHPDSRQLQAVLRQGGWSDLVVNAIQDFQCEVCFERQKPKVQRPAHVHTPREFNDLVLFDSTEWSDGNGHKYLFLHFIDSATNFQIAVPYYRQDTEGFLECFRSAWLRWAGNPREVMFDSATGFNSETVERYFQEHSIRSHVIPAEAHWQLGRAERHGSILQTMLDKYHVDHPISNWQEFEIALQLLCNAKNSLSRHAGYTPEILVLGKSQHVPGSNSDPSDSAGFLGLDMEDTPEGAQFAQRMAKREAARLAFLKADHSQALRRALHARSRPDRMSCQVGDHVMNEVWQRC